MCKLDKMDKRQIKTRKAIFEAFSTLLEEKIYSKITVQDIIDQANIGRSTFYAHFDTKDSLLKEILDEIFSHVFSKHLLSEDSHDFSDSKYHIDEKIIHIFYHLKDEKKDILPLLKSDSAEIFFEYFNGHLEDLFEKIVKKSELNLPKTYLKHFLISSFAASVKWWAHEGMKMPPEQMGRAYLSILSNKIDF